MMALRTVWFHVATVWLLFLTTFINGVPTENQDGSSSDSYDPVASTLNIMTKIPGDSFNRSWTEYRDGFNTQRGSNWHGLEKLHQLTNDGSEYQLIIVLSGRDASYSTCNEFKVDSEQQDYRVHCQPLPGYVQVLFDGSNFSTYDRGSRKSQASSVGFGWWFGRKQSESFNVSSMLLTKLNKKSLE